MAHLIIVTSAQLKTYLARFETLLAQEPAEQARLSEIEARRGEPLINGTTRIAPESAGRPLEAGPDPRGSENPRL